MKSCTSIEGTSPQLQNSKRTKPSSKRRDPKYIKTRSTSSVKHIFQEKAKTPPEDHPLI